MLSRILARLGAGGSGSSSRSTVTAARAAIAARRREDLRWLDTCLHGESRDGNDEAEVLERVSATVLSHMLSLLEDVHRARDTGFVLETRPSLVGPDAGDGLFVAHGAAEPGTAMTLYAGTAFFAETLDYFGGVQALWRVEETSHFIMCDSCILIDGLGKELPPLAGGALSSSDGGSSSDTAAAFLEHLEAVRSNGVAAPPDRAGGCGSGSGGNNGALLIAAGRDSLPSLPSHALASMANHPPPGVPANVIAVPVELDLQETAVRCPHLLALWPTRHAWRGGAQSAAYRPDSPGPFSSNENEHVTMTMTTTTNKKKSLLCAHSVVFVCSRPIRAGEEVYLDYATSPASRPPWMVDAARPPFVSSPVLPLSSMSSS